MTSKKYYRRAVRLVQALRATFWVVWVALGIYSALRLWDLPWALIAYSAVLYVPGLVVICYVTRLANGALAAYRQEQLPVEIYRQIGKRSILWDFGVSQENRA